MIYSNRMAVGTYHRVAEGRRCIRCGAKEMPGFTLKHGSSCRHKFNMPCINLLCPSCHRKSEDLAYGPTGLRIDGPDLTYPGLEPAEKENQ